MKGHAGAGEIGGFFSPLIEPSLLLKRLRNGTMQRTDAGLLKRCPRCGEFWPFDTEFFFACGSKTDGLYAWCRACYIEYRWPEGRMAWADRRDAQGAAS